MLNKYLAINQRMFSKTDGSVQRGYQKLFPGLVFSSPSGLEDFPITLADMGYTEQKMRNLKTFYSDDEGIEIFQEKMKNCRRDQESIYFTTVGEEKGGGKKDQCIRGISVNIIKGKVYNAHVFYRSSELSRKYLADLVFFRDHLWPNLFIPLDAPITFHFGNAYVHAKQYPMFLVIADKFNFNVVPPKDDVPMFNMIRRNLNNLTTGQGKDFGLIKTTNKMFRNRYAESIEFRNMISEIISTK